MKYSRLTFRSLGIPIATILTDEFFDNLKRIKEMEKAYHATLLFGHDYDQIMDWVAKGVID